MEMETVPSDNQNLNIDILNQIREWMNTKPSDFIISQFKEKLNTMICWSKADAITTDDVLAPNRKTFLFIYYEKITSNR